MDKRDLQDQFRSRLQNVIRRSGLRQAAFARSIGLDRSALSQLLSARSTRLPRVETLQRIGEAHQVSVDWLLGLTQSDRIASQFAETLEIEELQAGSDDTQLAKWHAEAIGYKIRYVPSQIPDLLRTAEVIEYQHGAGEGPRPETIIREAVQRRDYSRRPETDMEVCMPMHRLTDFAAGHGIWRGLDVAARRRQLDQMATLCSELYPTFRLFLFDGISLYSAPYTVFGPLRAAIYIGDMYLVLNGTEHIRALTNHFDRLIRQALVNPHEIGDHIRGLAQAV